MAADAFVGPFRGSTRKVASSRTVRARQAHRLALLHTHLLLRHKLAAPAADHLILPSKFFVYNDPTEPAPAGMERNGIPVRLCGIFMHGCQLFLPTRNSALVLLPRSFDCSTAKPVSPSIDSTSFREKECVCAGGLPHVLANRTPILIFSHMLMP